MKTKTFNHNETFSFCLMSQKMPAIQKLKMNLLFEFVLKAQYSKADRLGVSHKMLRNDKCLTALNCTGGKLLFVTYPNL